MASAVNSPELPESPPAAHGDKKDITEVIGSNGRWQFGVFLIFFTISIPGAGQNLSISFTAADIDFWCARPPEAANLSVEEWKELGLPPLDKQCSRYENFTSHFVDNQSSFIMPCDSWEFDHSFYSATLLEEFEMVCDREWLVSFCKSIFMIGLLFSVAIFGYLADRVGRKLTITISCWITFVSSAVGMFSSSLPLFLVARFCVALGVGGYYNNLYVLVMEITGPNMRVAYGNAIQLGWSVGFICLAGIVWLIRDSFYIQLTLTAPYIVFLGMWWMIDESPRWLLSIGKTEEARELMIRIYKRNKRNIPNVDKTLQDIIAVATQEFKTGQSTGNVLDLLRTPGLWQITLNLLFSWFVISFVYYGLTFNTNDLAGDPFVNFVASGAAELPAYALSILAIRRYGRKRPVVATVTAAGVICLASYFLPEDPVWIRSVFPVIGKFFVTCCYSMIYVYTAELFPTVLRSSGLGLVTFSEEAASIIAPFMRELGNATEPYVPFILFGIMATSSGLLTILLPETAGQKVPDTLQEAALISAKNREGKEKITGSSKVSNLSASRTTDDCSSLS